MTFSVIVKCERFTKHIRSQCASWIFLQAKLLLRCNRYRAGVRRAANDAGSLICLVNMAVGRVQFLRKRPYCGSLRKRADGNSRPGLGLPGRIELLRAHCLCRSCGIAWVCGGPLQTSAGWERM